MTTEQLWQRPVPGLLLRDLRQLPHLPQRRVDLVPDERTALVR
jgi:hypothetical protein